MPRVKIDLPVNFLNAPILIPVRITDINYGDHVGNDSLVGIIHEARMQFLQQHGYTELNIEGAGLIMSELVVEFKKESFYKDNIEVKIGVGDISSVSFELIYKLTCFRSNEEIVIAHAKTTMVCYDYEFNKIIPIPAGLRTVLTPD